MSGEPLFQGDGRELAACADRIEELRRAVNEEAQRRDRLETWPRDRGKPWPRCPASISGTCLDLTQGFGGCPEGECINTPDTLEPGQPDTDDELLALLDARTRNETNAWAAAQARLGRHVNDFELIHKSYDALRRKRDDVRELDAALEAQRIFTYGCGCPAPYDTCTHDEPLLSTMRRQERKIERLERENDRLVGLTAVQAMEAAEAVEQAEARQAEPHGEVLIEVLSEAAHEAWMESKRAQGITSRNSEWGEDLMVPYDELSEQAKDLDRGTVRGVLDAIDRAGLVVRAAQEKETDDG